MTHARNSTFTPIGRILADRALPGFQRTQKLPLRTSCLGTASYAGATDADYRDRDVSLGDAASPEDAIVLAAVRVSQGDIRNGDDDVLHFRPRLIVVQDNTLGLVLAGEIRTGSSSGSSPLPVMAKPAAS